MKHIIRLFILIAALVLGTDHAWADAESNPRVKFVYVNEQHGSAFASAVDSETGLVTITVTINEGEDYRCKAGDLTAEQSVNSSLGEARRRSPGDVEGPGKGVPVAVNYVETNKFKLALPDDDDMNVTVYVRFSEKIPLTVKANNHSIYYGCDAEDNGVEYSGNFEGDFDESVLEGELTYTFTNSNGEFGPDNNAPGEFVITPSGLTSPDYAITFVPGTLTVLPVTVKVSVVDTASGEKLEGGHLQVTDSEGNIIDEWDSGTEIHEVEGLKTGEEYTLSETVAPEGYILSSDDTFTIDEDGDITYTGTMTDNNVLLVKNSKTKVVVSVVDAADGEALADATVQIIDSNGDIVKEWVSSADDTDTEDVNESLYVIEGLKTGEEYTLKETVAPEGYVLSTDNTFTIDETGAITFAGSKTTDEEGNTVLLVENSKTKVVVSVIDIADGEVLAGATVQVKDSEGNVVEEWYSTADDTETSDVNESLYVIEGLKTGEEYTLSETDAPEGYVLSTDNTFTIDETGAITFVGSKTTDEEGNTVLQVENSKTKVVVSVVDAASGEALEGGHVQVWDSEGNVVEEWTSIADDTETEDVNESLYVIEGLKTGEEYTLKETVAPEGYVLSTDNTFTIDETGAITFAGSTTTDEEGNTVLQVENSKTKVVVSVVDAASGEALEGGHVQVLDSEGNLIDEWDSETESHVIEGLKTGEEYTLSETDAPEGYVLSTDNTFTIDETGAITFVGSKTTDEEGNTVLQVENSKTKVVVSVVDAASGEALEGGHVQVLDSEGNVVEEWTSIADDTETEDVNENFHVIEGLKTGEEYTLKETVAPEGYVITTDNTFTIDEDGKITSTGTMTEEGVLLVENSKTKVVVSVVNIADGEVLAGATVQVLDSEGNVVEEWTSIADDTETEDVNESLHVIEGLKTGETYTLGETVAPEGYVLSTDNTFTIDEAGGVTSTATISEDGVLLVENSKTKVEISVVDIANGEELAGATVQVLDSEGNVVEEWASAMEIHEVEGLKTGEEYTLRETVAPEGYVLSTGFTFTIGEDGDITSTATISEDGVLLVENNKTHVEISVVDVADGEELEGATVQVLDSEGNLVEEWLSTTENHVIEGLKTGEEYTLKETDAPDGYLISSDNTFTIDEDGEISSTGTLIDNTVLLVENSKTKVVVSVVNIADGEVLAGATVQVLDSEGNVVEEWTSIADDTETEDVNENLHVIEGLKTGEEYTLRETVAPDSYILSTDNTFTIDEEGNITFTGTMTENKVLLVKNIMFTEATIRISWHDSSDENRPESLTATLSDGSEVTLNSDNSWTVTVENLPMYNDDGDEITYTWTPGTLPDGYMMTDMSTEDGVTTTVTLTLVPVLEITEADGITADINEAWKGKTVNIAFGRTFEALSSGEGKASTVCLPFDLNKPSKTAVGTFYTFGGVSDDTGEYVVTMNEATTTTLPAGTPYLFKPATTDPITFQNTAYTVPDGGFTAGTVTDTNGWEFKGTYQEKTWEDGQKRLYGFATSEFEKSDGTELNDVGAFCRFNYGTCAAFRCYLMAPESFGVRGMGKAGNQLPESMKVILISASGEATAIGTIDTRTGEVTFGDNWYDLNGRRLNGKPTQKGMYINNGRKVVIKNYELRIKN